MSIVTFYVLHGTDDYNRKKQIQALQESMNDPSQLNTAFLDGSDVTAQGVINMVTAIPFLSEKRLVIVENYLTRLSGKGKGNKAELDVLVEALPNLPEFARLVFHEEKDLSDKNAVVKLARNSPTGFEKKFGVPQNLSKWIMSHAKSTHGMKISARAADALKSVIQDDLRIADSEIAKLAAYVNYEREITEDDVEAMTPYVAEANIFEMVDAIGQGNGQKAMGLAQQLLTNKKNDPLYLFTMITRQFRLLLLTREYMNLNGHTRGLESVLKVPPFVAQKKLPAQVRHFDLPTLKNFYHKLVDLDYEIKTGQIDSTIALQLFITGVTK